MFRLLIEKKYIVGVELFLLTLGFALIIATFYLQESRHGYRHDLDRGFGGDLDQIYIVRVDESNENTSVIYDRYREIEEAFSTNHLLEGIMSIQGPYQPENGKLLEDMRTYIPEGEKPVLFGASSNALKLCNVRLYKGDIGLQHMEEDEIGVWLGYAYRDIEVGTRYQENGYEYVVMGILEKDAVLPSGNFLYGNLENEEQGCIKLNNHFITYMPADRVLFLLKAKKGVSAVDVSEAVKEIGNQYGIRYLTSSLRADLITEEKRTDAMASEMSKAYFLIVLATISTIISLQITSIIRNRRMYGILIANGATVQDIFTMEMDELVIKLVISIIVATGAVYGILYQYLGLAYVTYNQSAIDLFHYILFHKVLLKALLVNIVVAVSGTLIPLLMILHMQPVDMIRKD